MRAAVRDPRVRYLTAHLLLPEPGQLRDPVLAARHDRAGRRAVRHRRSGCCRRSRSCSASLGLFVLGRRADREGDHRKLLTFGLALGAAGTIGVALAPPLAGIPLAAIGTFGVLGVIPVFWAVPTAILRDEAAAGGIALINAIGVSGGLFGPVIVGAIKDATGSLDGGLLVLGAVAARWRRCWRKITPVDPGARARR